MHGAPLFSALAAEATGVDLIYVRIPDWHENVAKSVSLNMQVMPFEDTFEDKDVEPSLELLATMDSAVIGPGMGHESMKAVNDLVAEATCKLVLDATALQPKTLDTVKGKIAVLTPHLAELERMKLDAADLGKASKKAGVTIILKDEEDQIAGRDGKIVKVKGGNAGLTVGGTGDALAGLIAGLLAQGMDPTEATVMGTTIIKRAATMLFHEFGYAFTTRRVIEQIPHLIHTYKQ